MQPSSRCTAQLPPAPRPAHSTRVPAHVPHVAAVTAVATPWPGRRGDTCYPDTCGHLCAGAGAAVVASPAFSSSVPLVEIRLLPSTRSSVSLFRRRPYLHTSSFALPLLTISSKNILANIKLHICQVPGISVTGSVQKHL